MEERIIIKNVNWYAESEAEQFRQLTESMYSRNSGEMLLLPDPVEAAYYVGIVLSSHYTPILSTLYGVIETTQADPFTCIRIARNSVWGYMRTLTRKMHLAKLKEAAAPNQEAPQPSDETLVNFETLFAPLENAEVEVSEKPPVSPTMAFLQNKSPSQIEEELNASIIGQQELTRSVADFLYYHALRQVHPELPQRPMLIAGPSGSGKTEVWRVAQRLYGSVFSIQIIDGSSLSCDGWAGNFKISTFVNTESANGAILVVDEFDKLAKPRHTSSGDNVSLDIQAEFLKLMEGEYKIVERKKETQLTSRQMGFVLVGAFESLRTRKEKAKAKTVSSIGFCTEAPKVCDAHGFASITLTDEDFIGYGIMPEIVGRIATKCLTRPLNAQAYIDIIRGPNSRVAQIEQVLKQYGVVIEDVVSNEEICQMVTASESNKTGVRWVSAQVETRLLEAIRKGGLFPSSPEAA